MSPLLTDQTASCISPDLVGYGQAFFESTHYIMKNQRGLHHWFRFQNTLYMLVQFHDFGSGAAVSLAGAQEIDPTAAGLSTLVLAIPSKV
jgi:hypothetical protein